MKDIQAGWGQHVLAFKNGRQLWRDVRSGVRVKAEAAIAEDWRVHWEEDIQINRPRETPATQGATLHIMVNGLQCKHELKGLHSQCRAWSLLLKFLVYAFMRLTSTSTHLCYDNFRPHVAQEGRWGQSAAGVAVWGYVWLLIRVTHLHNIP